MFPEVLGLALHDQQRAVRKANHHGLEISPLLVAQPELTRGAQTDGSDDGALTEFRLVVAVPAHAVVTIAIEIQQHAVEQPTARLLDLGLELPYHGQPGSGLEGKPRIAVSRTRISVPGGEPGRRDDSSADSNFMLLPVGSIQQPVEVGVGSRLRQESGNELNIAVG